MAKAFGVEWSDTARDDLEGILDYLGPEDPRAALTLLDRIEKRASALARLPQRGRVVPELAAVNVRRYRELIEGPFRILYFVEGKRVGVVAVFDSRRDLATVLLGRLLRQT